MPAVAPAASGGSSFDEVVPAVGGHAETHGRVGLVLGDLDAEQGRPVHPAQRLENAALVDDRDHERMPHGGGLLLRGSDHAVLNDPAVGVPCLAAGL